MVPSFGEKAAHRLACVHLDIDSWSEVEPYRGRLAWFSTPKRAAG